MGISTHGPASSILLGRSFTTLQTAISNSHSGRKKYTMLESTQYQRQIWLIFFFLGMVMLNFPFLQIFNRLDTILGFPLLVLYFSLGWPASIGVVYLFSRTLEHSDQNTED